MRNLKILKSEYAAFRSEIQDYFRDKVLKKPAVIYDPMAGTAQLIPFIEKNGHTAYLNDVLPIHAFVNKAKTYRVFQCYKRHGYDWFLQQLLNCMTPLKGKHLCMSDKWIDDTVLNGLTLAWQSAEHYEGNITTLLRAAILPCVRPLSSITKSKNPTWVKFGGVSSSRDLHEIAAEILARFDKYYTYHYESSYVKKRGECIFSVQNAAELKLPQRVDLILTSPPYCNRLDPIVLYGPENYFLSALGYNIPEKKLIGTTKVRDYTTLTENFEHITSISEYASVLLNNIRKSRNADDPGYYLKYYTRYFAALLNSMCEVLNNLSPKGKMYIVTQDNTHRGQLIEIDRVLRESLRREGWKSRLIKRWERHHLGLRTVSREHAFVRPKQFEKLVVVWR